MSEAKNVAIERQGDKIVLPPGMSFTKAREWLDRKEKEEETEVRFYEVINAFPFDAAYALAQVMAQKYGWVDQVPTPGFFGPNPPVMIGVEVAPGVTTQVPWGRIQVPNVQGYFDTQFAVKDGRLVFALNGVVRKKHQAALQEIADLTRAFVLENSLYKGKAIRIAFPQDADQKFNPNNSPKFMDTSKARPEELIFSSEVKRAVQTSLLTPVERTELCREYKIPLKRGILLEGPYGTGKTLTANVAARKCVENGWTFIYLETVADLQQALSFAQQYQPAMIFAEDIDRVMEGSERDHDMDAILNTIDGIESKSTEIIVVLTTNHVDKINQAMLRPGRLDAVISVKPPDAGAVAQLINLFSRGSLKQGEDLSQVGQMLQGQIPAVIREVVERAKLSAVNHLEVGYPLQLTAADLQEAAIGMLAHLELLKPRPQDNRTQVEKFGAVLGGAIEQGIKDSVYWHGELQGVPPPKATNGKGKTKLLTASSETSS